MRPAHRSWFSASFAALILFSFASASRADWPHDPVTGLQVAPGAFAQTAVRAASDGAGGTFFVWQQASGGTGFDVYAQHVTSRGLLASGWPAGGIALFAGANDQTNPTVMSDGAGGAYFAWEDARAGGGTRDIYVQRLRGDGSIPAGWVAGGIIAQTDSRDEYAPILTGDGATGVFVVWTYRFSLTDVDIYGAHFLANGTRAWSSALVNPSLPQFATAVVPDGAGGFIFAYTDSTAAQAEDVRAARFNGGGGGVWNTVVRGYAASQHGAVAAPDGEGGVIVGYLDNNSGIDHVFASRLTSSGGFAIGWSTTGNTVCFQPNGQGQLSMVSDGSHGAILGWVDLRNLSLDIYAERLDPYAQLAPGWVADGNQVCTVPSLKSQPAMAPDGSGGATFAWGDNRLGPISVYALRLTSGGSLPPGWAFNGVPIRTAPGTALGPAIAFDGVSSNVIAWPDARTGTNQIYANRVDRFGALGNPEPRITSIKDVAHDQGGEVAVVWNASWLDSDPIYNVAFYWMWRQVPLSLAAAAVTRGATWVENASPLQARSTPAAHSLYMKSPDAAADYAWEFVAQLAASGFAQYSYVAATVSDSMGAGNPRTAFMVQARGTTFGAFWNSAPDSGYSVDNLPPAVPAPFFGSYGGGSSVLHWGQNLEADLANYRLYRGTGPSFVPGPGNRIASPSDTGYTDVAGAPYWYKLSAVDIHGNESGFAVLLPSGTTAAPLPATPRELALARIEPNPARGAMTLRFSLPRDGGATLAIFDASGRRVRTLARGWRAAGDHAIPWDGLDEGGRPVADGLYFVRLDAEGRSLHTRFTRLR
jgi:hypothetical protein